MSMDTTGFFDYPTLGGDPPAPRASAAPPDPGFLPHASMEEWDAVLGATETLRFHPGDVVLRAGERDRAFYVLLDGRLAVDGGGAEVAAPSVFGVAAFLDDAPRAVTLRALTHGEAARMSWDGYEALAARDQRLGRAILVDLGRGLAVRLRGAGAALPGWTG
jgi:CRP/FNR family transcriptional regulator, cyclic AMP receptor protein